MARHCMAGFLNNHIRLFNKPGFNMIFHSILRFQFIHNNYQRHGILVAFKLILSEKRTALLRGLEIKNKWLTA